MPAPPGSKRVKGISIYRPFVYGSTATPLPSDPAQRAPGTPPDHTHRWTVYLRGVDGADVTHWLKKVQFKLHETYAQSLRTIEAPAPFEVTETGWGEFEVTIKLFFAPEANEKAQSIYHQLKLHPWTGDREAARLRGDTIVSQNYEEVVFNEPVDAFYDSLTSSGTAPDTPATARGGKGGAKAVSGAKGRKSIGASQSVERTAEIPAEESASNPYSSRNEAKELDRLTDALKQVDALVVKERETMREREVELDELRKSEGAALKGK